MAEETLCVPVLVVALVLVLGVMNWMSLFVTIPLAFIGWGLYKLFVLWQDKIARQPFRPTRKGY